ncbi:MAG: M3 family metallopeptidase [Acidobacteria bacterium]|nr:M3 family metallopeptidase [Acidobacteriota bacterium]
MSRATTTMVLTMVLILAAAVATAAPAANPGAAGPPAAKAAGKARAEDGKAAAGNPFFHAWKTPPFATPPFDRIRTEHFLPAFEEGMKRQKAEIAAIVANPKPPTFANTIVALDATGGFLARVGAVFYLLSGAETHEALQAVEARVKPMLAGHTDDIYMNEGLFRRVKAVYDRKGTLTLDAEQTMLLDRTYRRFVRGGANLDAARKERLRAVNAELSSLTVKFGDNLLKETNAFRLVVDREADLAGLPPGPVAAAAEAAKEAGLTGKWVFTLKGPSLWPFLESAGNRDLRRQILTAYTERCNHGGDTDNKAVFARLAALRVEKARLLGYPTWADFILDDYMAKKPAAVYALLESLWAPALKVARREAADLQAAIDAEKGGFRLEPWDWRFYANRELKAKFDLDPETVRPYFSLDRVRDGAFALANRLYGITFTPRKDIPVYHPEVTVFEVKEKDGRHLGILYLDFFPRPGKRGGAWCSGLQDQWVDRGRFVPPIVYNVCNFSRPVGDTPALLTADEVETLFHEFGHALHGLFSHVRYHGSGVVAQDFVELPSQIMENWMFEPEVLKLYARHYRTGELIPEELVRKIRSASRFGQGFATVEYLAASFLDMDWHTLTEPTEPDATVFEKKSLAKWGLMPEIFSRYRTTYFLHSADEYSAGYYSYIWSAVLDTDAYQAFKEKNNLFDPATAAAFRVLLASGGSVDAMELFKRFRGREPKVDALLEKRGLK